MERLTYRDEYGFAFIRGTDAIDLEERNDEAIEKLAAYEDAEEEGWLFKLPCKTGKSIFKISDNNIYEFDIHTVTFFKDGDIQFYLIRNDGEKRDHTFLSTLTEDGYFYSREEAEAKLKELETDNGRR